MCGGVVGQQATRMRNGLDATGQPLSGSIPDRTFNKTG